MCLPIRAAKQRLVAILVAVVAEYILRGAINESNCEYCHTCNAA